LCIVIGSFIVAGYIRIKKDMSTHEKIDYYILSLSQKKVSLLKMHDASSDEINDGVFPMLQKDDHEYAKSSRGNSFGYSLKNFEKDKSVVKKQRFNQFLREVDENLKAYITNDCALLLAGTDKDRSDFKKVSHFNNLIAGEVSGSFSSYNMNELKQTALKFLVN
jgi:hypothetical protein